VDAVDGVSVMRKLMIESYPESRFIFFGDTIKDVENKL
jgi:hypothetical protein